MPWLFLRRIFLFCTLKSDNFPPHFLAGVGCKRRAHSIPDGRPRFRTSILFDSSSTQPCFGPILRLNPVDRGIVAAFRAAVEPWETEIRPGKRPLGWPMATLSEVMKSKTNSARARCACAKGRRNPSLTVLVCSVKYRNYSRLHR